VFFSAEAARLELSGHDDGDLSPPEDSGAASLDDLALESAFSDGVCQYGRKPTQIAGGDVSPQERSWLAKAELDALAPQRVWAIGVFLDEGWSLTEISLAARRNRDWAAGILSRYRKSLDRNGAVRERLTLKRLSADAIAAAFNQAHRAPHRCSTVYSSCGPALLRANTGHEARRNTTNGRSRNVQ
jgi:hypothetical protein